MKLRLLFFAGLRDLTGIDECDAEVPSDVRRVGDLKEWLAAAYPALRFDGVRFAVDEEFVALDDLVRDGATVALLPPVSGG